MDANAGSSLSYTDAHAFVAARTPDELRSEVGRALSTADDDGAALERASRLAEMGLVVKLAPWRAGSVVPNVRKAIERIARGDDQDAATAGLALRLAACYARRGRADDEAIRLARYARARLHVGGLAPDERAYATEASQHLERGVFLPSIECAHEIVEGLDAEGVLREVRAQLARRNASFAALLGELGLLRTYGGKRFGPITPGTIEKGLAAYRESLARGGGRMHAELACALARAYVEGSFVDVRARDHARAVTQHLGDKVESELAAKLKAYLDQDAFDLSDAEVYRRVQSFAKAQPLDLRLEVAIHTGKGNLVLARRVCELDLVRRFDPWYLGDPTSNVARAVNRAAGLGALDEDARWVACSLAALYAATLEEAVHARALVDAVLGKQAAAPELRAALEHAGLDPDVPLEELWRIYREATDTRARLERFRSLADAAALPESERAAGEEVLEWLASQERAQQATGGLTDVKRRLGDLVEVVVPEALLATATGAIEAALRNAAAESARRLGRARIARELAKAGIASVEDARSADLAVLDRVAWSLTHENRVFAALEGLGCGLGGATLVLLDLPALVSVNLNAIAAIATVYGFDAEAPDEVERALALLALGSQALNGDLEQTRVGTVAIRRMTGEGALGGGRAALALRAVAVRLGGRLAKRKLLQLVPVLGSAVGAGLNFHFTLETTRAAYMLYRYRWILRRARGGRP
jgi:hypothetical protein